MKKGLSILLVAAAMFGFYGTAVNLNDILACKDYWEEAGEKSTADMNKLEDGLNQLKDNEQAYLDGLDQVAEGEKALADGEAELAQGEADYAAAPGKLAAARAQLAAGWSAYRKGQSDLAAGQKEYNDGADKLRKLTAGIKTLEENYNNWKDKYDNNVQSLIKGNSEAVPPVAAKHDAYGNDYSEFFDANNNIKLAEAAGAVDSAKAAFAEYHGPVEASVGAIKEDGSNLQEVVEKTAGAYVKKAQGAMQAAMAIAQNYNGAITFDDEDNPAGVDVSKITEANYNGGEKDVDHSAAKFEASHYLTEVGANTGKAQGAAITGSKFANISLLAGVAKGKKDLQAGIQSLFDQLGEENIKEMGKPAEIQQLQALLFNSGDAGFEMGADLLVTKAEDLLKSKNAELAAGKKKLDDGKTELAAGLKKLKSGEKQYAQGLADYEAAPAKLADGRQQLADGLAALMAGKDQLAQYEDGEQQVRDGLATLVGTEADLDLESILDRLNGDSDFDNGDNHLELDEGLAAVEVGRGYQAEDGELITKEIMTRAIATGGLLAAGVLAVLAAILSFTKKNKGAGFCAILSAVAGAFGAYEATQAGSYFSSIAGSTVGQSGMIAAGILGCVALVHAIVHFTAKKEA